MEIWASIESQDIEKVCEAWKAEITLLAQSLEALSRIYWQLRRPGPTCFLTFVIRHTIIRSLMSEVTIIQSPAAQEAYSDDPDLRAEQEKLIHEMHAVAFPGSL